MKGNPADIVGGLVDKLLANLSRMEAILRRTDNPALTSLLGSGKKQELTEFFESYLLVKLLAVLNGMIRITP